jgi:hypothetical protein
MIVIPSEVAWRAVVERRREDLEEVTLKVYAAGSFDSASLRSG